MTNLTPLCHIIADICMWRSTYSPLIDDVEYIINVSETRGESFVMIDFPEACKVLDAAISRGWIDYSKLPHTLRRKRADGLYQPTVFKCLFDELFFADGNAFAELDVNVVFFLRQLLLLYKKVDLVCPQEAIDKAISEFIKIEGEMRAPSLNWSHDQLDLENLQALSYDDANVNLELFGERRIPPKLLRVLKRVGDLVLSEFPLFDALQVIPKHGPGSVSDGKTGFDKYSFPTWPKKLSGMFDCETFAMHNYQASTDGLVLSDDEPPARLIAVPKTLKSPRLIASEPTAHQFLQQGLLRWFRENLSETLMAAVDFKSQEPSRLGALRASVKGDEATVDLSSASDRLSCWFVERFFGCRPDLLQALHSVRTRTVLIDSPTLGRQRLLLKKYANQGSAITFCLQTIMYACICVSALIFERGKTPSKTIIRRYFRQIRVFGDDLIVPSECVFSLGTLLTYLGLKVNWDKTHFRGQFRESCGMDAYAGFDITPVYLSSFSPSFDFVGLSSWVDVSNVAYSRGLWSLSDYMKSVIPEKYAKLIPISPMPMSCLHFHTYQRYTRTSCPTKWAATTQQVVGLGLTANVAKKSSGRVGSQDLLHFFLSEYDRRVADLPVYAKSVSRRRSFGYRVRLKTRWVPLVAYGELV